MNRILKIGSILIREGIIDKEQLDSILEIQKKAPDLTVGEIAAKKFDIPEQTIETVFADQILGETIKQQFLEAVSKKLKGIELSKIVTGIDLIINSYTRKSVINKEYSRHNDNEFSPSSEKNYLSKINCTVDTITIKTTLNGDMIFKNVEVDFHVTNQRVSFLNEAIILEVKVRIVQLLKKLNGYSR